MSAWIGRGEDEGKKSTMKRGLAVFCKSKIGDQGFLIRGTGIRVSAISVQYSNWTMCRNSSPISHAGTLSSVPCSGNHQFW